MKILFLTHYAALYGANRSLIDLLNGLKKHPVIPFVIVTEKGPLTEYFDSNSISYYIVPFRVGVEYRWKSRNQVKQLIRNIQYFAIACCKFIVNKRYLRTISGIAKKESIDLIYTNSSVITIGHALSIKISIPQIFHVRELITKLSLVPDFGYRHYKNLMPKSTHQIFISHYVNDHSPTSGASKNYSILYDGVSKPEVLSINVEVNSDRILSFGIIGYLCRQKNQIEVLEAFSLLKNVKANLVFVGGGDVNEFREAAMKLGVDKNSYFIGFHEDMDSCYSNFDVVIIPAINEALGRATIEAMIRGIPVIGKNSGATPELIEHNVTGLIYDDTHDLADKMQVLISNRHLGLQIAATAQLKAKKTFDLDVYSEKIFNIIKNCIG